MPEITALGWFHTATGLVALVSGTLALVKHHEIKPSTGVGRIYLVTTLVTAATALLIFQHGGFGPAHGLAVLTLLALAAGTLAAKTEVLGSASRYVQATAYTSTLLFHAIPAVTDALMRLPVGNPLLSSIEDPVLKASYLLLLIVFLVGCMFQLRWIHRHR
jgi:uncharacterized membrane protein